MNPILQRFLAPASAAPAVDGALLGLRLWLGLTMALNHGLGKLTGFSEMAGKFPDPIGLGSTPSLALAVFAEFFCALLLAAGLVTRFAAFNLAFTMGVAFFMVHSASLKPGPGSGELAFVYLAGFAALLASGPGRFSLDAKIFSSAGGGASGA